MSAQQEKAPNLSRPDANLVVEKMKPAQISCADMIITRKSQGKLVRRDGEPGSYTYDTEIGEFPKLTIATNPAREFVGAENLKRPQEKTDLLLYFLNLRGSSEEDYKIMAQAVYDAGIPFEFDYIVGIPNTGPHIGKPLAKLYDVPYFELLEKAGEGEGREFRLKEFEDGELKPEKGQKGLVVDDLVTKDTTKRIAKSVLIDGEYEIAGFSVVVDRQEGGFSNMKDDGENIEAALTATQLFARAYQLGEVDDKVYDLVMKNIQKFEKERVNKKLEAKFKEAQDSYDGLGIS
jgi:orotate phosphoribosyltransferase